MSIERKLLSRLTDPADLQEVWEMGLRPEVFEDPLNRWVFEYIRDYWHTSRMTATPTPTVIEHERPGFRFEENVEEQAWWLAEALMKRHSTNVVQDLCLSAAKTCTEDPIGTLHQMQQVIFEATEAIVPRTTRSDMSDHEDRLHRYAHPSTVAHGVTLGIPELDKQVNGLLPGELCAVGAYSKVGKTMFLLNAAVAARRAGYTPIVFTLEMSIKEMKGRIDALFSGVSYDRLSRECLTPTEIDTLNQALPILTELGPMHIESPPEGERTVSHLVSRAHHVGADYLIIDQLCFIEETGRFESEKRRQASIIKQLKNAISSGRKIPCLMAAQLRRESLDRKDGPKLNDFADAAEVERTCDLLLALSRSDQQLQNRVMRLDILASRRAPIASYLLDWQLTDYTRIAWMENI